MDYSKTVQLPQTEFPMRARLAEREPQRLEEWERKGLYRKLQELGKAEGRELFVLHDGPPFANGHIHLGTALNKRFKDMVVRSKSMDGYRGALRSRLGHPRPAHRVAGRRGAGGRSAPPRDPWNFARPAASTRLKYVDDPARGVSSAWASGATGTTPT